VGKSADDRDPLFTTAASISDGAEIDWQDVGRAAVDEETTAILVQLQVVERIARVHSAPGSRSRVRVPRSGFCSRFMLSGRGRKPRT
jgi:hypothetical protein